MKRKKSRHKQAAVDFLSRISLQGYSNASQTVSRHITCSTAAIIETASGKLHQDEYGTAPPCDHQLIRFRTFLSRDTSDERPVFRCSEQYKLGSNKLQNGGSQTLWRSLPLLEKSHTQNRNLKDVSDTKLPVDDVLHHNRSTKNLDPSLPSGNQLTFTNHATGAMQPSAPSRKHVKSVEVNESSSRQGLTVKATSPIRRLIISCGLHRSPLTLCSVLSYARRTSAYLNKHAYRASPPFNAGNTTSHVGAACNPTEGSGFPTLQHRPVSSPESSSVCISVPPGTGKTTHNLFNPTSHYAKESTPSAGFHATGVGAIYQAPHSFRQVGDEVISVAVFLRHCRPSFSTPWSNVLQRFHHHCFRHHHHHHQCTSCYNKIGASTVDGAPKGSLRTTGYCTCHSVSRSAELASETVVADHVGADFDTCRSSQIAPSFSRHPGLVVLPNGSDRTFLDSINKLAGSPTANSTIRPLSYPDPLIHYLPNLLDDPDLLVATGKRFMQLPSYLATVLTYVRPNEQKRNVNLEFHNRFPNIQLTLTKLRSLKSVIVRIVHKLSMDLWIAAHAHVLFEKLILRLMITKMNRKAYASAALLISAKLNDVKGPDLSSLIQEIENMFRISRRDLIHAELEAFFNLEFCLIPAESDVFPHYLRIHKDIDVAPLVPSVCISRNLLQLIPDSVIVEPGSGSG